MVLIEINNTIIKSDKINTKDIYNFIKNTYQINDFFLTKDSFILKNDDELYENDKVVVNCRVRGGIMKILEPVFEPILKPFKDIIMAVVGILELVIELVLLLPKIIELIINIFSPDKLINDVIYGVNMGIRTMITGLLGDTFSKIPKNKKKKNDGKGGIFGVEEPNKTVCVSPNFINLLILILCPPLALLMHKGIKYWYLIILCGLMTYYLYYIPGFIFAALHILC